MKTRLVVLAACATIALLAALPFTGYASAQGAQGGILAWGDNTYGQTNVPAGNFENVYCGAANTLGVTTAGDVIAWGDNSKGQCNVPSLGEQVQYMFMGGYHGFVYGTQHYSSFGDNTYGQRNLPSWIGLEVYVESVGLYHTIYAASEIMGDSWVGGLGLNTDGQCTIPQVVQDGIWVYTASGGYHNVWVMYDEHSDTEGPLTCWGNNTYGQCSPPAGNNYTMTAGGLYHSLALDSGGRVHAWGRNDAGQCNAPSDAGFVDIAAGDTYSMARKSNGQIVCWGSGPAAQAPEGTGYSSMAAGGKHAAATCVMQTVTASVNNGHGQVSPALQKVPQGTAAKVQFIPEDGYHVLSVTDNGTSMPVANPYVVNNITCTHAVTVNFAPDHIYHQVASSVSGGHGWVSPASQNIVEGNSARVDLEAETGWHPASITDNGIAQPLSDPYIINNVLKDHQVVVTFAQDQQNYKVEASVSGGHGWIDPPTQSIAPGGSASVDITAEAGHHLASITDNGEQVPPADPYIINPVNRDHGVVVTFEADEPDYEVMASVAGGHGWAAPQSQSVQPGGSASIDINAETGYHLVSITDNGVAKGLSDPYVISPVQQDHTVITGFAPNLPDYQVNASVYAGHGWVSPPTQSIQPGGGASIDISAEGGYHLASITDNGVAKPLSDPYVICHVEENHGVVVGFARDEVDYEVAASVSGGHGTVGPATQTVSPGGTATINITPDPGYHVAAIVDNGVHVVPASPYIINPVNLDHGVVVSFAPDKSNYQVSASVSGGHGWVDPPVQTVSPGGSAGINITADTGRHIEEITDNGVQVPVADPYLLTEVNADHQVAVTFGTDVFTVTAQVASGQGSVAPASQQVPYGGTATVNITPASGWAIDQVKDNGAAKPASSPFTISDVRCDHAVSASFKQGPPDNHVWYLAEGSSAWGFSTCYSIANPNEEDVHVRLTWMTAGGEVRPPAVLVPARSQATIDPSDFIKYSMDFSLEAECIEGKEIGVDRTMSWTGSGAPAAERHSSIGATSPSTDWHIPEGCSAYGFETWTLVQNPGAVDAACTLTYMIEGAAPRSFTRAVKAHSRASFGMLDDIGPASASVRVESDVPVVVEQSVYRNARREGMCSTAYPYLPGPDSRGDHHCYLAEGTTAYGFTTYILLENPSASSAHVRLTFMTDAGPVTAPAFEMEPGTRKTVNANGFLDWKNFSTVVASDRPVVAQRSMLWGGGTPLGEACHGTIGALEPAESWLLPDGQSSGGCETYTLVANPNSSDVKVRVSYLSDAGGFNVDVETTVQAGSRRTFNMADSVPSGRYAIVVESLSPGKGLVAERAMYWDGRASGTSTIGR